MWRCVCMRVSRNAEVVAVPESTMQFHESKCMDALKMHKHTTMAYYHWPTHFSVNPNYITGYDEHHDDLR